MSFTQHKAIPHLSSVEHKEGILKNVPVFFSFYNEIRWGPMSSVCQQKKESQSDLEKQEGQ